MTRHPGSLEIDRPISTSEAMQEFRADGARRSAERLALVSLASPAAEMAPKQDATPRAEPATGEAPSAKQPAPTRSRWTNSNISGYTR